MATLNQMPAQVDVTAVKGDNLLLTFTVTENAVAYDWTGATVSTGIIQDKVLSPVSFTVSTPVNGTLQLSLTAAQTTALGSGLARWYVKVTKNSVTRSWVAGQLSMSDAGWGAASNSTTATLSITTGSSVIDVTGQFVGPTGPAGPTGATGPTGPAGPAGPTGPANQIILNQFFV